MRLWRQWGWIRRALLALSLVAFFYFGALVALGLLQADFDARVFSVGVVEMINLERNETRKVYLTAEESQPLNFDFYPSDLNCEMEGPNGETVNGQLLEDERRLVDGWRMHWGIESFTAPASGTYELICRDGADRTYPLVLASQSAYGPYKVSPGFGLLMFVLTLLLLGPALLIGRRRDRSAASTA